MRMAARMTRAALYEKHTGLADAIAREWFLPGADMDDVHQEARVALWIATATWKPEKGLKFRTYARHAIKADLRDKVQSANRHKHRVLTDADRDELQLSLIETAPLERTVIARERLREALEAA